MTLFYACGGRPVYADTIASHNHVFLFAISVKKGGVHSLAVFHAELEHMPNFNASDDPEFFSTARTYITLSYDSQIGIIPYLKVSSNITVFYMMIFSVGPCNKIFHACKGIIRDNSGFYSHGTGKSFGRPRNFQDGIVHGEFKRVTPEVVPEFCLVYILITPYQHSYRFIVTHEYHRFYDIPGCNI